MSNTNNSSNFGNTHRHIFIFTEVKLGIDGSIGKFGKAAKKLWDELCSETLLLWATFDAIQNNLVGILMLQRSQEVHLNYLMNEFLMRKSFKVWGTYFDL